MGLFWLGSMWVRELTSGDFQLSKQYLLMDENCQWTYGKIVIFIIITKWIIKHGKVKESQMALPHWTVTESIIITIIYYCCCCFEDLLYSGLWLTLSWLLWYIRLHLTFGCTAFARHEGFKWIIILTVYLLNILQVQPLSTVYGLTFRLGPAIDWLRSVNWQVPVFKTEAE